MAEDSNSTNPVQFLNSLEEYLSQEYVAQARARKLASDMELRVAEFERSINEMKSALEQEKAKIQNASRNIESIIAAIGSSGHSPEIFMATAKSRLEISVASGLISADLPLEPAPKKRGRPHGSKNKPKINTENQHDIHADGKGSVVSEELPKPPVVDNEVTQIEEAPPKVATIYYVDNDASETLINKNLVPEVEAISEVEAITELLDQMLPEPAIMPKEIPSVSYVDEDTIVSSETSTPRRGRIAAPKPEQVSNHEITVEKSEVTVDDDILTSAIHFAVKDEVGVDLTQPVDAQPRRGRLAKPLEVSHERIERIIAKPDGISAQVEGVQEQVAHGEFVPDTTSIQEDDASPEDIDWSQMSFS